jgi:hypothetical protein
VKGFVALPEVYTFGNHHPMPPYTITTNYRMELRDVISLTIAVGVAFVFIVQSFKLAEGSLHFDERTLFTIAFASITALASREILSKAARSFLATVEITVDDESLKVCQRILFFKSTDKFPLLDISHCRPSLEHIVVSETRVMGFKVSEATENRPAFEFNYKSEPQVIGVEWDKVDYNQLAAEISKRKKVLHV